MSWICLSGMQHSNPPSTLGLRAHRAMISGDLGLFSIQLFSTSLSARLWSQYILLTKSRQVQPHNADLPLQLRGKWLNRVHFFFNSYFLSYRQREVHLSVWFINQHQFHHLNLMLWGELSGGTLSLISNGLPEWCHKLPNTNDQTLKRQKVIKRETLKRHRYYQLRENGRWALFKWDMFWL